MEHGVTANLEISERKIALKERSIANFNEFGNEWADEVSFEFDNKKGEIIITLPFKDVSEENFIAYRITKLLGNKICLCDGRIITKDVAFVAQNIKKYGDVLAEGVDTLIDAFGMSFTDKGIENPIGVMYGHEGYEQAVRRAVQAMLLLHVMAVEYAVQIKNGAESGAVLDALLGKNR